MIYKIDNQEVYTERLHLRRFIEEDTDTYCRIMSSNEIGKWLPRGRGLIREEVEGLLKHFNGHWSIKGFGAWAVVDRESGALMGHCGLNTIDSTSEVEVLYALSSQFWGKGYATEAAKLSVGFALDYLNLNRIIALSKPDNDRSRRVIEKIGFKFIDEREYFKMQCAYYEIVR